MVTIYQHCKGGYYKLCGLKSGEQITALNKNTKTGQNTPLGVFFVLSVLGRFGDDLFSNRRKHLVVKKEILKIFTISLYTIFVGHSK